MPSPIPAAAALTHLLYLHGFRSSPNSAKAQRVRHWMATHRPEVHWWCPQLPPSPAAAMALLDAGTRDWPAASMAVVGSSLGGCYARAVAAQRGCRAVLLNPAVRPSRDLAQHLGEQTSWHDPETRLTFDSSHIDELRAIEGAPLPHPERLLAIVAKGDEVLDWREMVAAHAGCALRLIEGSDHALSDFDSHLPALLAHLGLTPPA